MQVIATRVSTGDECSIIIEDGLPAGKSYSDVVTELTPRPLWPWQYLRNSDLCKSFLGTGKASQGPDLRAAQGVEILTGEGHAEPDLHRRGRRHNQLDVKRSPRPMNWAHLMQIVRDLASNLQGFRTIVFDTSDWMERLAVAHILGINGSTEMGKDASGKRTGGNPRS